MHPRFQGLTAILLALFAAGPWAVAEDRPVLLLAQAIRAKDLVAVNRLLAEKADPNVPVPGDSRMRTPLLVAVEESTPEITKALLEAGADPKAADDDGDPVIFLAAKAGRLPHAKLLIERGVSIDSRNSEEQTLILRSVHYLEEADARAILGLGANPDLTDELGRTALMMAAEAGNVALVRVLIEGGAKLDLQDQEGKSALIWTVANSSGASDDKGVVKEIIGLLGKAKANPNLRDSSGQTALMTALDSYWTENEVIEALLAAKPDIAIKNKDGQDALFLAVRGKDRAVHIPKLLELGADIKTTDHHGTDLLMLASRGGNVDLVADLLSRGFSPRALDRTGWNAAHHVADAYISRNDPFSPDGDQQKKVAEKEKRFLDILKLLHKHGAPLDTPDNEGRTPLHLAAMQGNDFAAGFLIPHQPDLGLFDGSGESALHYAAANGSTSMVEMFLEKMKQPDLRDLAGATPLQLACDAGNEEMVLLLLDAGAELDAVDRAGNTALARAVKKSDYGMTRFLLARGAKVELLKEPGVALLRVARTFHDRSLPAADYVFAVGLLAPLAKESDRGDPEGVTALMWVAASNNQEALKALLSSKPSLDSRSHDGRTALMWAAASGAEDSMRLLIEAGADGSLADPSGRDAAGWLAWSKDERTPDEPAIEMAGSLRDKIQQGYRLAVASYLERGEWDAEDRIAGSAPLHLAAALGDIDALTVMLGRGARVDQQLEDGATPLIEAAGNGQSEAVSFLLQRGANPGIRDRRESTAAETAAARGHIGITRILEQKASSSSMDGTGLLTILVRQGDEQVLREFLKSGLSISPARLAAESDPCCGGRGDEADPEDVLIAAAARPDSRMLRALVDFPEATGASRPELMISALYQASAQGRLENVKFLIEEKKVDPDVLIDDSFGGTSLVFPQSGSEGYSALSRALEEGHQEVVRYLVDRGTPIRGRTRAGQPPLVFAINQRRSEMLKLFLEHGVPLDLVDGHGETALHHAVRLDDPELVRRLLEKGADASVKSKQGQTPLELARGEEAAKARAVLEAHSK